MKLPLILLASSFALYTGLIAYALFAPPLVTRESTQPGYLPALCILCLAALLLYVGTIDISGTLLLPASTFTLNRLFLGSIFGIILATGFLRLVLMVTREDSTLLLIPLLGFPVGQAALIQSPLRVRALTHIFLSSVIGAGTLFATVATYILLAASLFD